MKYLHTRRKFKIIFLVLKQNVREDLVFVCVYLHGCQFFQRQQCALVQRSELVSLQFSGNATIIITIPNILTEKQLHKALFYIKQYLFKLSKWFVFNFNLKFHANYRVGADRRIRSQPTSAMEGDNSKLLEFSSNCIKYSQTFSGEFN